MRLTRSLRQRVALRLLKDMTARAFKCGVMAFGSVDSFVEAPVKEWAKVKDLSRIALARQQTKAFWEDADREIERARRAGIEIIAGDDAAYPTLLKEIDDPPFLLYLKGKLPDASRVALAVVGSREASSHGLRMAAHYGESFARAGAVVVSGLARGVDTAAHQGCLDGGGVTLAVEGCGLLQTYPPQNKKLAEKIVASGGALITEFPLDAKPISHHFPMRNRIISGLSRAVVVAEARPKSGALITADLALEQGRDVYVIPGNAESVKAGGSNALMQQGARVSLEPGDVLREYGLSVMEKKTKAAVLAQASLSSEEKALLRVLKRSATMHMDEIGERGRWTSAQTMTLLTSLTLKGAVRELPGKYFEEVGS